MRFGHLPYLGHDASSPSRITPALLKAAKPQHIKVPIRAERPRCRTKAPTRVAQGFRGLAGPPFGETRPYLWYLGHWCLLDTGQHM